MTTRQVDECGTYDFRNSAANGPCRNKFPCRDHPIRFTHYYKMHNNEYGSRQWPPTDICKCCGWDKEKYEKMQVFRESPGTFRMEK